MTGRRTITAAAVVPLLTLLLTAASCWLTPATAAPTTATAAAAGVLAAGDEDTCLGPDIRCTLTDAAASAARSGLGVLPGTGKAAVDVALGSIPNPLAELGGAVVRAAADAWTAAMLTLWSAGLFLLRLGLAFSEWFLTPDVRATGPGKDVYAYALWMAAALVVIMAMVQLGMAAFKREGKSLARVFIGAAQFVIVWSAWLGYCAVVLTACTGLTKALMKALLGVNTWPDWDLLGGSGVDDITDGVVATVLGLLGCLLWVAALGHLLIMLGRAAALLVLVASGPISAAGLVSDAGRSWFWKSLRWFHAAAFTPVVMVLVLGIGVQFSTGVAAGLADSSAKAIGTALPAVLLLCIGCVAPLALFKLLAFVDPGTPSGASFRQGLAMAGGVQGLLSGAAAPGGSSAASQTDQHGRSAGESGAEGATTDRFTQSTQGPLATLGGAAGSTLATGIGLVSSIGSHGAGLLADETNQAGVGHHTYGPDFSNLHDRKNTGQRRGGSAQPKDGSDDLSPSLPLPLSDPLPGGSFGGAAPAGAATPAAGAGAGGGGGAAASGAAGAAAVPPVPV